jgi:hypothetical protein
VSKIRHTEPKSDIQSLWLRGWRLGRNLTAV